MIAYHCYPDFIHCRDPKAGQGHYEPRKPKGIGINTCFTCNLQEVSIELLVSLVHLCIKCLLTVTVFSTPLGCVPLPDCLPLTTVVYSTQRSFKIHWLELATPACGTRGVCARACTRRWTVCCRPLWRCPSAICKWLQETEILSISDESLLILVNSTG